MRLTSNMVSDHSGWRIIDARTGLELFKSGRWVMIYADDSTHCIEVCLVHPMADVRNGVMLEDIIISKVIHAPRLIIDIPRKTILLNVADPNEMREREMEMAA